MNSRFRIPACMPIIPVTKNIDYIASFGEKWIQSVLLKKVDLAYLEENRRDASSGSATFKNSIGNKLGMKKSVYPHHFKFSHLELATHPKEIILSYFKGSSFEFEVKRWISNAQLTAGDFRWRSDLTESGLVISGNSDLTVGSLIGLSHELGHCLYEANVCKESDFVSVLSEACAMSLEHWVLRNSLSASIKQEWIKFQEEVDLLNQRFDEYEKAELQVEAPYHNYLLPLRETYYTAFRYQSVYRNASAVRARLFQLPVSDVNELMSAFLN